MGITEQIFEMLLNLIEEVSEIRNEISQTKKGNEVILTPNENVLSLKFTEEDKINIFVSSKILGMTKAEIVLQVKKGNLNSIGKKKYIFLGSELIRFMNQNKKVVKVKENKPVKNINSHVSKQKSKMFINEIISEKEMNELLALKNTDKQKQAV